MMAIKELDHNAKIIEYMEQSISNYSQGNKPLSTLASNIETSVSYLKDVSEEWKKRIITPLNQMDILCGYVDNSRPFNTEELVRINNYIEKIESAINDYKKEHLEDSGIDEEYEEYMRLYPDDKL